MALLLQSSTNVFPKNNLKVKSLTKISNKISMKENPPSTIQLKCYSWVLSMHGLYTIQEKIKRVFQLKAISFKNILNQEN